MSAQSDPRDSNDQAVFRRVGVMTILWIILLIVAGLALLLSGDQLFHLVS